MAIAVGQKAAAHSSGSATTVTTSGVATTASGSTFVVLIQADASLNTPSDNKGNTYTAVTAQVTNSGINSRMYYCQNGTGGSGHTFTFTTGFSANLSIYALEITGGLTSGILDVQNAGLDSSSPFTVTTGTTTQAAELAVAGLSGNSGSTPATHAESTGYTIQAQVTTGGPDWPGCIASKVLAATGTQTPSFTESGATTGGVHCATFKEASASGSPYTMAAATGAFTLTGNAAGLAFGHKLAAAQATYTLTGNAAGLVHGYPMVAASGSFTLTGNAAGLTVQRKLAADQASFTLTGVAAGLTAQRKLTAAQASYTLTGNDAALSYTQTVLPQSRGGFDPTRRPSRANDERDEDARRLREVIEAALEGEKPVSVATQAVLKSDSATVAEIGANQLSALLAAAEESNARAKTLERLEAKIEEAVRIERIRRDDEELIELLGASGLLQ